MKPVRFDGMNCIFKAPGCEDLPTLKTEQDGTVAVTSVWRPSAEDLEILNAGGCICLNVHGGQPPVALWAQQVSVIG